MGGLKGFSVVAAVLLRGSKASVANGRLDVLEVELPQMQSPYRSAAIESASAALAQMGSKHPTNRRPLEQRETRFRVLPRVIEGAGRVDDVEDENPIRSKGLPSRGKQGFQISDAPHQSKCLPSAHDPA